jgi:hypothetical protein
MITLLLICCLSSYAGCRQTEVKTVEVIASVNCTKDCIAVTRAFVEEHAAVMTENVRLKAELTACHLRRPSSLRLAVQP